MRRIVDLSHPVNPQIPAYPGDPPYQVTISLVATGKGVPVPVPNLSRIQIGLHVGTHGDAPYHFVPNGDTIEKVDLSRGFGPATLVSLEHLKPQQEIQPADLHPHRDQIQANTRVLLRTGWDRRFRESDYFTHHPVISTAAAQLLVDWGVVCVGLDFPSVDYPPYSTHFVLLENKVFIVENLTRLDQLPEHGFSVAFLPLALEGRDGSPLRAIAWIDE